MSRALDDTFKEGYFIVENMKNNNILEIETFNIKEVKIITRYGCETGFSPHLRSAFPLRRRQYSFYFKIIQEYAVQQIIKLMEDTKDFFTSKKIKLKASLFLQNNEQMLVDIKSGTIYFEDRNFNIDHIGIPDGWESNYNSLALCQIRAITGRKERAMRIYWDEGWRANFRVDFVEGEIRRTIKGGSCDEWE